MRGYEAIWGEFLAVRGMANRRLRLEGVLALAVSLTLTARPGMTPRTPQLEATPPIPMTGIGVLRKCFDLAK